MFMVKIAGMHGCSSSYVPGKSYASKGEGLDMAAQSAYVLQLFTFPVLSALIGG